MATARFDTLARALARSKTRRGMLHGLVLASTGLPARSGVQDAAAKNCKKIENPKKRQKCRRRNLAPPAAFGCTADDNSCSEGVIGRPCPDKPSGVCNVTFDGFPMCTENVSPLCVNCGRHDTCQNLLGSKAARCIRCPNCVEGFERSCSRAA